MTRPSNERDGACSCDPVPLSCGGEGPSETCEVHGRPYREWVERGDILQARIAAVKEVIAKARRTPAAHDPYHVAREIADDLEAAVYLEPAEPRSVAELRAALMSPSPAPFFNSPSSECCASGRCEVCSPGFDWGRDG